MFMLREFAACFIIVSMFGALLLIACGIGYMVKAIGGMLVRTIKTVASGTPILGEGTRSGDIRNGIFMPTDQTVIANSPS